ncbi:alpha/beta hydrolase [Natronolimnobius sp. AArcel1]|uniref:alpha/beta fold hydrolase n=1 Tax=Natronolimnobius sp. AArcel1 TaxID=1679093 RepID=UPI0013EDC414|nr:alpha/beta hydrolase [Natronolimnobius sp. AArcel1]NGM68614.1 alpha/beta hydrolase [Natronolimnobius sp. AArcel1]
MPRAMRDGVSLSYDHERADSDGSSETIVFLQGLGFGRWMWRWQRQELGDEYDIIAPDTRGTGRSDAGLPPLVSRLPRRVRNPLISRVAGYSLAGLAADLDVILQDAGVRHAHLVGADLGGLIAQEYALEYTRAASLTLIGSTHGGPDAAPMPEETREQLFGAPSGSDRETLRNRMRPAFSERFTNRNPHLMDRIIEWRREQDATGAARTAQAAALMSGSVSDRLPQLTTPTLVIHGTDDRVSPATNARLLAERIPNTHLELLEGGAHCVFIENDEQVATLIRTALEDGLESLESESVVQAADAN